ncbi:MAG TPA: hypothetical protein VKT49_18700 [Bryobacteraceae bacterium]|nr:hypothetical protein [Bryobacteraceae bacterium]
MNRLFPISFRHRERLPLEQFAHEVLKPEFLKEYPTMTAAEREGWLQVFPEWRPDAERLTTAAHAETGGAN